MEELTKGDTPSDVECGFFMEVRDPGTSSEFIIYGYYNNEEWEALSDEENDTNNKMIEPSIYEDKETQEDGEASQVCIIEKLVEDWRACMGHG